MVKLNIDYKRHPEHPAFEDKKVGMVPEHKTNPFLKIVHRFISAIKKAVKSITGSK